MNEINLDQSPDPLQPEAPVTSRAVEGLDPAGQALSDALRVSFRILKLVMIGIVIVFLCSGFYTVEPNHVAVVLRFGKVQGSGESRVKTEGLHWKLPAPIDSVVQIPSAKAQQTLSVGDLWYYERPEERIGQATSRPGQQLQYLRDGYTLTAAESVATFSLDQGKTIADYNIIHSRWVVQYHVMEPLVFLETLWNGASTGWDAVEQILRAELCDTVVQISAQKDLNWIVYDETEQFRLAVQELFAGRIAGLNVGLAIDQVVRDGQPIPPRQVKDVFDQASGAKQDKQAALNEAYSQQAAVLTGARADGEKILADARAYKTEIYEAARADAKNLKDLVEGIRLSAAQGIGDDSPDAKQRRDEAFDQLLAITVDQKYQEMLRQIFAQAREVMVLSAKEGEEVELRPIINRNPELGKKKKSE